MLADQSVNTSYISDNLDRSTVGHIEGCRMDGGQIDGVSPINESPKMPVSESKHAAKLLTEDGKTFSDKTLEIKPLGIKNLDDKSPERHPEEGVDKSPEGTLLATPCFNGDMEGQLLHKSNK